MVFGLDVIFVGSDYVIFILLPLLVQIVWVLTVTFVSSGTPGISSLQPSSSDRCRCSLFILYVEITSITFMISSIPKKFLATSKIIIIMYER